MVPLTSAHAASACIPPDADLRGYWQLDEAAASDPVLDISGNTYTGTPSGPAGANNLPQPAGVTSSILFQNDFSKNFDGTDDGIDLGSSVGNLELGDTFTVSAWINPDLDAVDHTIYGNTWSTAGFMLRVTSANTLRFILVENGSVYNGMDSGVLSSGWHHVAGVWDGVNVKVYVDGVDSSLTPVSAGTVTSITSTANTFIGQTPEAGSEKFFAGDIDDVRLYETGLSGAQIARLAAGRCGVEQFTSVTTLASDGSPSIVGDPVIFTATVTGFDPTGTVEIKEGPTVLGTVTLGNGSGTFVTSSLSVGSHDITAEYAGDDENISSVSLLSTQVVEKSPTSESIVANPVSSVVGNAVAFTVTVTGVNPTGTVDLTEGATLLGTITLGNGSGTFVTGSLSVGSHDLTASYNGDTNNETSTGSLLGYIVSQSPTSTTTLSVDNPAIVGEDVTFTATVTGFNPTGTVDIKENGVTFGTVTLGNGSGTFVTSSLSVGSHTITGYYAGDTNNDVSTGSILVQVIDQSPTSTTTLSVTNPAIVGENVTFTATVTGFNPTGTVTLKEDGVSFGTITLSNGTGAFVISSLSVGSHNVTGMYNGDGNNTVSTGSLLVQVIDQSPTSTTTLSVPNPSVVGNAVTFTATVTGFNPTGTVEIKEGPTVLGTVTLGNGSGTFVTSSLSVGSHTITGYYAGDTNNDVSTGSILVQIINKASPTVSLISSANPAIVGEDVTFTATLSGSYQATGTLTFYEGATLLGSASVGSTSGSLVLNSLSVGSHTITVEYDGDTNNDPASSTTAVVQTIEKSSSSVDLATSANPGVTNQDVTFYVTVSGYNPTGTVQLFNGSNLMGNIVLGHGSGSFVTSEFVVGTYDISASYLGDTNNLPGASTIIVATIIPSNGSGRGGGTQSLGAHARFVAGQVFGLNGKNGIAPGSFGGGPDVPLSKEEKHFICSMQKSIQQRPPRAGIEWLASYIGSMINRDPTTILNALKDTALCASGAPQAATATKLIAFNVDVAGFPVSSNPTWNKCITGRISLADIRSNPDKDEDGLSRDCSDYHTGDVWYHPDLQIQFSFDKKQRTVSLPAGYIVKKEGAVTQR